MVPTDASMASVPARPLRFAGHRLTKSFLRLAHVTRLVRLKVARPSRPALQFKGHLADRPSDSLPRREWVARPRAARQARRLRLEPLARLAAAAAATAGLALVALGTAAAVLAASPPAAVPPRSAAAAPPPAAGAANVLKDRVLAVVDEDPVLASDLDRAIVVGQLRPNPGEAEEAFRRRVLQDLVAQRLRFHEIDRFGLEQVPVDQIEKQVADIRARFKDDATFRRQLKEVGLDEAALRQMMARQLEVLAFVDERLGPQVFVGLDDIATYYRDVLTPQLQKEHLPVPRIEDVRDQIREVLRQQRLTEEIDRWTEELRRKANIAIYIDQPAGGPLPPVVKRLEPGKKPTASPAKPPAKPPG